VHPCRNQEQAALPVSPTTALGVANPTVDRYVDLLVDLQLLRRLRHEMQAIGMDELVACCVRNPGSDPGFATETSFSRDTSSATDPGEIG
jgi:hypothetical protein